MLKISSKLLPNFKGYCSSPEIIIDLLQKSEILGKCVDMYHVML